MTRPAHPKDLASTIPRYSVIGLMDLTTDHILQCVREAIGNGELENYAIRLSEQEVASLKPDAGSRWCPEQDSNLHGA